MNKLIKKIIIKTKNNFFLLKNLLLILKKFDVNFYLKCYPRLYQNKFYAYIHYMNYGRKENRLGQLPLLIDGLSKFCEKKATILLVSHDASRTGAPILALNLCQELNKHYNVIVLFLKDGTLEPHFKSFCHKFMKVMKNDAVPISNCQYVINFAINYLTQQYAIKLCIVNSIESGRVLEELSQQFIPSLLLIHEFTAYTRPLDKFSNALFWAGTSIFPAKIVQKNAVDKYSFELLKTTHVIPQGQSLIPSLSNDFAIKNENLKKHLHSKKSLKPFVVLGAGTVYFRKGTDLFISTAAEIQRLCPDHNIKMIWVGGNFIPDEDPYYSCFLADQIERSNVIDCFEFIEEVSDLDTIYDKTDLFFLSSRLDPLPNVAIDVMLRGIPLVCFQDSTGIAEILSQDQDTSKCIVPYLNVTDAARIIIDLSNSQEHYSLISNRIQNLAQKNFDMKAYVSKLLELGSEQIKMSELEALDYLTLCSSGDYLEHFSLPHFPREIAIKHYIRSWHSQMILFRKPTPGFNREIYDKHYQCRARGVEPFAEYIRNGKPSGPWQDPIITPSSIAKNLFNQPSTAIHIHAFYPDLLGDILEKLNLTKLQYDLFISTNTDHAAEIRKVLLTYKMKNYNLQIVPNRGRDLGPFLTEFAEKLQAYEIIGHFHTKKSLDVKNPEIIKTWMNFLLENLIGSKNNMANQIILEFVQDPKLGLVFADDPHLLGWDKNKPYADELAKKMNLNPLSENRFSFPVGTMFWARYKALEPLFKLGWSWDMYPEEPLPYDGSILHAIERLIPKITTQQGFKHAVTYVPGITR